MKAKGEESEEISRTILKRNIKGTERTGAAHPGCKI